MKKCLECGKDIINGRSDKIFCNGICKSIYHNRRRFYIEVPFSRNIDNQLHKNRNVLKEFYSYSNGQKWIPVKPLYIAGFDPTLFNFILKNKEKENLYVLYDYAFHSDLINNLIFIHYDQYGFKNV